MKDLPFAIWRKVLEKRRDEVAKVRDKLEKDLDEMSGLLDSCQRAHEDIESAIAALSELA
jgi:hypothetical protein